MNRQNFADDPQAIRGAREALGLSRLGLAYRAEVDLRTIERIETGDVTPRRSTLAVINAALAEVEAEQTGAAA